VPRSQFASRDFYDVWVPDLSPSAGLVKKALGARSDAQRRAFFKRYAVEMKRPEAARLLDLLSALSQATNFSVGCYCEDESRCHRRRLRELLRARGAKLR
jgi:uncharacterized protein YeaO (DUF488 family)